MEPLTESELALVVSRTLSYSVMSLCVLMKLPQIRSLLSSKSAAGISLRSYWLEISTYFIGFFYGYVNDFHFSVYAESGFLILQDVAIIFLIVKYNRDWTFENLLYAILCVTFVVSSLAGVVPQSLFRLLLSSTLVTGSLSKLGQILSLYRLKSQGDVSVVTWSLVAYGCLARVFTVLVEVGDLQILANYAVSFVLNSTVVALCLYYGKGQKKLK